MVVASLHTMVDLPMTALVLLGGTKASEIADCDARAAPKTRDLTMIGLFVWGVRRRDTVVRRSIAIAKMMLAWRLSLWCLHLLRSACMCAATSWSELVCLALSIWDLLGRIGDRALCEHDVIPAYVISTRS